MLDYKHIERLVYIRPDGVVYTLHAPPSRVVISQEGFGMPPLEYVVDRAPFQHGDNVRSMYLGPRPIQLGVLHNFCSREEYWNGRNLLLDTLRPRSGPSTPQPGQLLYYLPGRKKRAIDVMIDSGPGFVAPQPGWRSWSFTEVLRFVAHDVTWYDPNTHAQTLIYTQTQAQLLFPAVFPIYFSQTAGLPGTIFYTGTWEEYPIVDVVGPVTGFVLINTVTGDQIGLSAAVPASYTVRFDLRRIKTVTGSDGANWLNRVTSDSDLASFSLVPDPQAPNGANTMALSGTSTDIGSQAIVSWRSRYFGI